MGTKESKLTKCNCLKATGSDYECPIDNSEENCKAHETELCPNYEEP